MKGLDIYETKDGFTVAKLHYTADPDKDPEREGAEWIKKAMKGFPGGKTGAAWRKEMEIDFTAYSGQLLCYDILTNYRAKIVKDYEIKENYKKFGSLDWGRNNPASFHEYIVGENGHIHSNHEVYVRDTSIADFCAMIKEAPYYKDYLWITADPSIWNRNQETKDGLRSLETLFAQNGLVLRKGISRHDDLAIEELLSRWGNLEANNARFTISPRCYKQIWEFERLRYRDLTTAMIEQKNPYEQLVDKDNHAWDDFKYFISTWLSEPEQLIEHAIPKGSVAYEMFMDEKTAKDWKRKYK
jgi:hypothetical protein